MAAPNPTDRGANLPDPESTAAEDARTEYTILSLLLDEHPVRLRADDIALVLNGEPRLINPQDAAEVAVHRLASFGLVHRDGLFVVPSRAALYFERLAQAHQ